MDTPGRTATASVCRRVRPDQIHAVLAQGSNCDLRGLRIGHGHTGAIHGHLHRMFMGRHVLLGACSNILVDTGAQGRPRLRRSCSLAAGHLLR